MSSHNITKFRHNRKKLIIDCMGGQCQICNYSKCQAALELHHIDPNQKEIQISNSCNYSWSKISNELKKCILLCSNCHREVHNKVSEIPENYHKFKDLIAIEKNAKIMFDQCPVCNNTKKIQNKTCSYSCSSTLRNSIGWENIDLIHKIEIEKQSYCSIAKEMNCSDNAVRKRYLKIKKFPKQSEALPIELRLNNL